MQTETDRRKKMESYKVCEEGEGKKGRQRGRSANVTRISRQTDTERRR